MNDGTIGAAIDESANHQNLNLEQFLYDSESVKSTVLIEAIGTGGLFRVTHDYHPSATTPNLYEVVVTIENLSAEPQPVLYRRVLDWDAGPTYFAEYVTIDAGTATDVVRSDTNGFNSSDPCTFSGAEPGPVAGDPPLVDTGPRDHGVVFDFEFYTSSAPLGPGEIREFSTFFGATENELRAYEALDAVAAEAYSFGQPSCPSTTVPECIGHDGPRLGEPNTFILAFNGVSGVCGADPIPPDQGNVVRAVKDGLSVSLSFDSATATRWRVYRDSSKSLATLDALTPDSDLASYLDRDAVSPILGDSLYYVVRGLSPCSYTPGP